MKIYRERNREKLLAQQKDYYHTIRKACPRPSRRKDPDAKCLTCSVRLTSKYGGKGRRLYCTDCGTSPKITTARYRIYYRRGYQKRAGKVQEDVKQTLIKIFEPIPLTNISRLS